MVICRPLHSHRIQSKSKSLLFQVFLISKTYAKSDIFTVFRFFELYFQAFSTVSKVRITVQHGTLDQKKDVMNIWIESSSRGKFEVCLRESRTFDGPHSNLKVACHNFRINELNMQAWKQKQAVGCQCTHGSDTINRQYSGSWMIRYIK